MSKKILGIHHVSSIVGHPQENIDFYAGILGLKLVKQTLNNDVADHFHLYFGNHLGSVGTTTTFFPLPLSKPGKIGGGQVGVTTYAIPLGTLDFWSKRLMSFGIPFFATSRFDLNYLFIKDPHGLDIELVETNLAIPNHHEFNGVTKENSLKGIYSVILNSTDYEATTKLLVEILGYEISAEDSRLQRLVLHSNLGGIIEVVKKNLNLGVSGVGTSSQVAFAVREEDLLGWRELLMEKGYNPSPITDRKYFKSIYFKDPGGILLELSSITPGLLVDESLESLGSKLQIPLQNNTYHENVMLMPLIVSPIDRFLKRNYTNYFEYQMQERHTVLLKRINELAAIAKNRTLSPGELQERYELRLKYIENMTYGVKSLMSQVKMVDKDGVISEIKKK